MHKDWFSHVKVRTREMLAKVVSTVHMWGALLYWCQMGTRCQLHAMTIQTLMRLWPISTMNKYALSIYKKNYPKFQVHMQYLLYWNHFFGNIFYFIQKKKAEQHRPVYLSPIELRCITNMDSNLINNSWKSPFIHIHKLSLELSIFLSLITQIHCDYFRCVNHAFPFIKISHVA